MTKRPTNRIKRLPNGLIEPHATMLTSDDVVTRRQPGLKRRFFIPSLSKSVEASGHDAAIRLSKRKQER